MVTHSPATYTQVPYHILNLALFISIIVTPAPGPISFIGISGPPGGGYTCQASPIRNCLPWGQYITQMFYHWWLSDEQCIQLIFLHCRPNDD